MRGRGRRAQQVGRCGDKIRKDEKGDDFQGDSGDKGLFF